MKKCVTALYKRIASVLAEKTSEPYSTTMALIRCRLSFALVRASMMCIRGSRSKVFNHDIHPFALAVAAEAAIPRP